jgi:hypothetical protein
MTPKAVGHLLPGGVARPDTGLAGLFFATLLPKDSLVVAMSRASKLTLAVTGMGTAGIVYFVHWAQEQDRAVCIRICRLQQLETDQFGGIGHA